MASLDEVVRLSGYSRSTVFRYLAGKNVRPAAAGAIRQAMREAGFPARTEPGPHEDIMILLSLPADFEGFRGFADVVEAVMKRSARERIAVAFDRAQARAQTGTSGKRFGVIIVGKRRQEEEGEWALLKGEGIPAVFVNRMPEDPEASWVSVDFRLAAADAAARLAEAGCRRIAAYADTDDRRVEAEKLEGARRAVAGFSSGRSPAAGTTETVGIVAPSCEAGLELRVFSPADGELEAIAAAELGRKDRPDGWLAFSDTDAMRIVRVAGTLGLSVPRDLSVVGMNDVEGAAWFSPALTSVNIPFRECGTTAVEILLRLLDNPREAAVKITMRHRLVERESCAGSAR